MTKYLLNSGGLKNEPEKAKKFFAEMVEGLGMNPQILICSFAQPREDWETRFAEYQKDMPKLFPESVKPIMELASPETFEEQIEKSDVVYIHGGDDYLLQFWLRQFNLPKIWENKVVAVSSAGSDALSTYFWTCDWRKCMTGLAILPIKFLPHYTSSFGAEDPRGLIDWEKAMTDLKNYKEDLPIYALKEGEYVVFNQ